MIESSEQTTRSAPLVLLVASAGGHFMQLYMLEKVLWKHYPHLWVTFRKKDTESMLKDRQTFWAYWPTNRNAVNFLRNLRLAIRIIHTHRPTAVVSTGAGVGVPFLLLGWLYGIETIFIESFARKKTLSLSGRLVYPFVDHFFVQTDYLAQKFKRAVYLGSIY